VSRSWRIPFAVPAYLVVAWPVYLATRDNRELINDFAFRIPDLSESPLRAAATLVSAPFFAHSKDQIVYTTAMLVLFGLAAEYRFGWRVAIALFFLTTFAAGIIAGAILHLIYPEVVDGGAFRSAWNRTFSGGSAGAVGLNGAFAAMMPKPFLFLALFAAWELGLWWFYLQNYTPVFHTSALLTGFAIAWFILRGGPARPPRP